MAFGRRRTTWSLLASVTHMLPAWSSASWSGLTGPRPISRLCAPRAAVERDRGAGLVAAARVADPERERAGGRLHRHRLRRRHARRQVDRRQDVGRERAPAHGAERGDARAVTELADDDVARDRVEVRERERHRAARARVRGEPDLAGVRVGLGVREGDARVGAVAEGRDRERVARAHRGHEVLQLADVHRGAAAERVVDLLLGRCAGDLVRRPASPGRPPSTGRRRSGRTSRGRA